MSFSGKLKAMAFLLTSKKEIMLYKETIWKP